MSCTRPKPATRQSTKQVSVDKFRAHIDLCVPYLYSLNHIFRVSSQNFSNMLSKTVIRRVCVYLLDWMCVYYCMCVVCTCVCVRVKLRMNLCLNYGVDCLGSSNDYPTIYIDNIAFSSCLFIILLLKYLWNNFLSPFKAYIIVVSRSSRD